MIWLINVQNSTRSNKNKNTDHVSTVCLGDDGEVFLEGVAHADPLLLYEGLEASEGPEVGVQEHLAQAGQQARHLAARHLWSRNIIHHKMVSLLWKHPFSECFSCAFNFLLSYKQSRL